jgi:diguanylate cyclase (GGDEF)-like protein
MRALWNILPSFKPRATWWHAPYVGLSILAGCVGLILSLCAAFTVWHRAHQLAELELTARASNYEQTLQFGINNYMRRVAALRALFESTKVSRELFEKFSTQVLSGQSAMRGMSWVPRVTREERNAHERAAVVDGLSDYQIKSLTADGVLASAPERQEYFPMFYAVSGPRGVYGLDLNDGGARQRTLERARDGALLATSPHLTLVNGVGDRRGFFVVLPVYRSGPPHDTVDDRRNHLLGFVHAGFQTSILLESLIKAATKVEGLDLYFYPGGDSPEQSTPLYFHGGSADTAANGPRPRAALIAGPHWSGTLSVGDASWTSIAVPVPGGPATASHTAGWVVLICGLLLTTALVAYTWRTGHSNEQLSTQNRRTDAAINNMVQGFLMFDADERIIICNDRYIEMYGLSREIVKPGCSFLTLLQHRVETGLLSLEPHQYRADLLSELSKGAVVEWIVTTTDGRDIFISNKPMLGGGWIVTHEDITERRRAEAKISHMALHDGLTDLPNRHLFSAQVEKHFAQMTRGQKFAVLCLDLDHFKEINDSLGHPFGDKLLVQVGARLRGCVRQTDIVARLASDEFAILQGNLTDIAETKSLAARIIDTIAAPFDLDGQQVTVGVSIGIAFVPDDASNTVQLLKAADQALYRAKAIGRGTYRCFEPEMDQHLQARRFLERDLRKALANDEFVVHYQPLVNLQSEQICGFEALIRWNHPERGMIPPLDFIPFAEESGLIVPIGEWVLRTACAEAAKWPGNVRIAVNLSPVQFRTPNLYDAVTNALSHSGLAADRLELEITESALLSNQDSTVLAQLRELGVRIAMDDFGTGHSSLSYLRSFPFDKIKIDRCCIHGLATKKDCRAIISAVAQLAISLGIETTAEGVETQEELDYLKRSGCTEAQGYFFSKAKPAKDVSVMLGVARTQSMAVA